MKINIIFVVWILTILIALIGFKLQDKVVIFERDGMFYAVAPAYTDEALEKLKKQYPNTVVIDKLTNKKLNLIIAVKIKDPEFSN